MKYRYKSYGLVCCVLLIIMIVSSVHVYADTRSVTACIPVSCVSEDSNERFTYQLKTEASSYQSNIINTLKLTNGEKLAFDITYTYPGTYQYEVIQVKGTDKNTVYDDSVYKVTVYVTEDSTGLDAYVIAYKDGDSDKTDELVFKNRRCSGTDDTEPDNDGTHGSGKTDNNKIVPGVQTSDVDNMIWCICGIAAALLVIVLVMIRRRAGDYDEK